MRFSLSARLEIGATHGARPPTAVDARAMTTRVENKGGADGTRPLTAEDNRLRQKLFKDGNLEKFTMKTAVVEATVFEKMLARRTRPNGSQRYGQCTCLQM